MTKGEKDVRTNVCYFVLNILMMFMDVYGKYFELNDYECLDDLLMVC